MAWRSLARRALLGALTLTAIAGAVRSADAAATPSAATGDVRAVTQAYVEQFYPLWFTYYQSQYATRNRLIGPDRVSPLYQIVVAINVDTLYASTFVDVAEQPIVLSVPSTTGAYSVLVLDPYGTIYHPGIPSQSPGESLPATTYVLTSPDFAGTLPPGLTRITMPLDLTTLIFRADRHTPSGEDQSAAADQFRRAITMQPLCAYEQQPCPDEPNEIPGDATLIFPEIAFAVPFKTAADGLIRYDAVAFLRQLQVAVRSDQTPPMSASEQELSDAFDALFGDGDPVRAERAAFVAGAKAAHRAILRSYLDHRGPTNWIHFTNIGDWGDRVVERAAITEFIQYGNGIDTAAYYQAFRDGDGGALDGRNPDGYVLHFPADQIPQAERFWSLTAYTPESIELVENPADKYVVASYTSGLEYEPDGSLNVHLAHTRPPGVPEANWLPAPAGPFNVMLRIYGVVPDSSIANDTYVPPGVQRLRRRPVRPADALPTLVPIQPR